VLPPDTQKTFLEKDFVAFQFMELTLEQEEDLFARVQMGVQLTAAEKMRAKQGPWQELAKLFVDDFPTIYNLMKDRARAKDFQLTLSCFSQIVEVKHPAAENGIPTLKTNYSKLPKLLSNGGAVDDALKSHLASVWSTLRELIELDPNTFTNADKHLKGVQTFAPVEMVAATVLISMYSESRNNQLLLGDIRALREALREHFQDLRLNPTVWRFVWGFIENLEAIRGAVDGTTVMRNQLAEAPKSTPSTSRMQTIASPTATVPRKRAAMSKPLSILPPHDSVVAGNEPQPNFAAPKRQRTDPGPSFAQAGISSPIFEIVGNPSQFGAATNSRSERTRPAAAPTRSTVVGYMIAQSSSQQTSPISVTSASPCPRGAGASPHTNTVSNQSPQIGPMYTKEAPVPIARGPARLPRHKTSQQPRNEIKDHTPFDAAYHQADYLIPDLSNAPSQLYHRSRLPSTQLYATHTPTTPEPIRPQIQQDCAAEPSNYHAPVASMQPSQNDTMTALRPSDTTQGRPTNRGAFAPTYTDQDWAGVIASKSPQMPSRQLPMQPTSSSAASTPTVPALSTVVPKPKNVNRKGVNHPTPAQLDGIIDLTSDDELEEERQNLLSSFKAQTGPAKQPSASAVPAADAPTGSAQRKTLVIHDLDSDEDHALAKNPYERFKTNPGAGLAGTKR
jgi:hypothetical protein